jgi:signal transduction histidine kinase
MTNVLRHSLATRVDIGIVRRGDPDSQARIEVSIEDDGRGADLGAPRTGLGLVGMRERVAACGGTLRLQSDPGGGFKVLATVPCS